MCQQFCVARGTLFFSVCDLTRRYLYEAGVGFFFGDVISRKKKKINFGLHEVPLAKSESNLTELLGWKRRWERFAPRREEKYLLSSFFFFFFFSSLQWESILEEYEDEIFSLIAQEADYLADKLCSEKSVLLFRTSVNHRELFLP
uniref:Uncharacterized protein n=1 Tax=Calidris pygmaea TaxID=425635 RepID=A0A8C3PJN5_9CHAR